jgi:hypothetical protein
VVESSDHCEQLFPLDSFAGVVHDRKPIGWRHATSPRWVVKAWQLPALHRDELA